MRTVTTIAFCAVLIARGGYADSADAVSVKTRAELQQALANATPGTTILIAPGTYAGGFSAGGLRGTKDKPVVIAAADPKRPPVIEGGNAGLHLSSPAYVELRNLVFSKAGGNGLNIDDGGSPQTPAQNVVLRNVTVRDIGAGGNQDGIKLSGVVDFSVEDCTVERWGKRGSAIDMVGCRNGEVTNCTFRQGDADASGVQMKGGSRDIAVRHCRFDNAGGRAVNIGGSTGLAYFRPGPQGYEAKDIVVEDCTFIGSMAPIAFVGVDGATVRHNTIYHPARWVARILQETQDPKFVPCRNGRFTNNIVVFRSDQLAAAVNVGPQTAPNTFRFAENFWYCSDVPEGTRNLVRLPTAETGGIYGRDPGFRDAPAGDLKRAANGPARNFGPRERVIGH